MTAGGRPAALRAQGSLGEPDYVTAQFLHLRPHPLLLSAAALLALAVLVTLALTQSVLLFSTCTALASYVLLVMPWRARRQYRRNPVIAQAVSIDIGDDGLCFHRSGGDRLLRWSQIQRWRGSKRQVLLYPTPGGFYAVPAAFFERTEDFTAFTGLLRQHVGEPG